MKITVEFLARLRNWDLKSNIGITHSNLNKNDRTLSKFAERLTSENLRTKSAYLRLKTDLESKRNEL